ncbi:MAG: aminotransferase class I/II-fold pyridoxal phosphate-dependent enzyme [Lautropia sp.]|nr:aminotransferase class I/II-fold pyridoxal phosphate-dependent enzyme [Lautropia sp.]
MTFFSSVTTHGGPDAQGAAAHDFSTNANAAGPCPSVLAHLQSLTADTYPDPAHTQLVQALAAWHGVDSRQIIIGASASELIGRLTAALVGLHGPQLPVFVPAHAYGDYARAAAAWGLPYQIWDTASPPGSDEMPASPVPPPRLFWACEPTSPLGGLQPGLATLAARRLTEDVVVVDRVYAPLQLQGGSSLSDEAWAGLWQLHSPNKALGLTGVRGAWLLAPANASDALVARLHALAPSWPLGSHASQMLLDWTTPAVHAWLAQSLPLLRHWKQMLVEGLRQRGWRVRESLTNFFCAEPPAQQGSVPALLARLRGHDIKLRDATSFGLAGQIRLGVRRPQDQEVLWHALDA